jgi:catechol 2,3-dioxygenase-like lactoylglutathione lyase family enzyme
MTRIDRWLVAAASSLTLGGCLHVQHTTIAAPEAAAEASYQGSYVKRQLLVVSDIDRALTLWRDVLGFEVNPVTVSGPQSYSREVFAIPPEAQLRFTTLNAGPGQQRTLALLEVRGVALPPQDGIRRAGAVIDVRGRLREIAARARAMGLTVLTERPLVTAHQGTGLEQGLIDWDGNVIVLYELPRSDPPNRN